MKECYTTRPRQNGMSGRIFVPMLSMFLIETMHQGVGN